MFREEREVEVHLLDVVAGASALTADVAASALLAPASRRVLGVDADAARRQLLRTARGGTVSRRHGVLAARLVAVDADEVTAQVVLAAERAPASAVGANVGLETVRVVRCQVRLQIVGARECWTD